MFVYTYVYSIVNIPNNNLSASCACIPGRQPHVALNRIIYGVIHITKIPEWHSTFYIPIHCVRVCVVQDVVYACKYVIKQIGVSSHVQL